MDFFGIRFLYCLHIELVGSQIARKITLFRPSNALFFTTERELSGLCPEPRWGAQSAPQTPSSIFAWILTGTLILKENNFQGILFFPLAPLEKIL